MATRLEKLTPREYEEAYMGLVEKNAPIQYKEALARDFGRDHPDEYRAFRRAFRAGQIKTSDYTASPARPGNSIPEDYQSNIFEQFLVGLTVPVKPIAEPIINLLGMEFYQPTPVTLGEQVAYGTGSLITTVIEAIALRGLIGKIPLMARMARRGTVMGQAAIRGVTSLLQSGIVQGYEVGKGRRGIEDAAKDIATTVVTSTISVLPEHMVRRGFYNMASQVAVDLAADMGIDAYRGIDITSKEWWVNEIPRVGLSLGYGARDWADSGFIPRWNPTGKSLIALNKAGEAMRGKEATPEDVQNMMRDMAYEDQPAKTEAQKNLVEALARIANAAKLSSEGKDPNLDNDANKVAPIIVPKKPIEETQRKLNLGDKKRRVEEQMKARTMRDEEGEMVSAQVRAEDEMIDAEVFAREPEREPEFGYVDAKVVSGKAEELPGRAPPEPSLEKAPPKPEEDEIRSPLNLAERMFKRKEQSGIFNRLALNKLARNWEKPDFVRIIRQNIRNPDNIPSERELYQVHNYATNEVPVKRFSIIDNFLDWLFPGHVGPDGRRSKGTDQNSIADYLTGGRLVYAESPYHNDGDEVRRAFGDDEIKEETWHKAALRRYSADAPYGYAYAGKISDGTRTYFAPMEVALMDAIRDNPEALRKRADQWADEIEAAGFRMNDDLREEIRGFNEIRLASEISVHNVHMELFGPKYGTLTDKEIADRSQNLFATGTRFDPTIVRPVRALRVPDLFAKDENGDEILDKKGNPYLATDGEIVYHPDLIPEFTKSLGLDPSTAILKPGSIVIRDGDKTLIIKGNMRPAYGKFLERMNEREKDIIIFDSTAKVDMGYGPKAEFMINPDSFYIKTTEHELDRQATYTRQSFNFTPLKLFKKLLNKTIRVPLERWEKFILEAEMDPVKFNKSILKRVAKQIDTRVTSYRNIFLGDSISPLTPIVDSIVKGVFGNGLMKMKQDNGALLTFASDLNGDVPPGKVAIPKAVYDRLGKDKRVVAIRSPIARPNNIQILEAIIHPEGVLGNVAIVNGRIALDIWREILMAISSRLYQLQTFPMIIWNISRG